MTDIVERIRTKEAAPYGSVLLDAAAEIERLRMENSQLLEQAALRERSNLELDMQAIMHINNELKAEIAMTDIVERLREHVRQLTATLSEQDTAIAALEAANAAQRTEIQRLNTHISKQDAEIERLRELKTPASRELLNITKGCLDDAETEIERLRTKLADAQGDIMRLRKAREAKP